MAARGADVEIVRGPGVQQARSRLCIAVYYAVKDEVRQRVRRRLAGVAKVLESLRGWRSAPVLVRLMDQVPEHKYIMQMIMHGISLCAEKWYSVLIVYSNA